MFYCFTVSILQAEISNIAAHRDGESIFRVRDLEEFNIEDAEIEIVSRYVAS